MHCVPCWVTSAPRARPRVLEVLPTARSSVLLLALQREGKRLLGRPTSSQTLSSGLGRNWKQTTPQHPLLWDQSPESWGFPGASVVKTPCHRCGGRGFNPWSGH